MLNPAAREDVKLIMDSNSTATLERAAAATGTSLAEFMVNTSLAAAQEILGHGEAHLLSDRDWDGLVQAIETQTAPNTALIEAMRSHRKCAIDR